MSDKGRMSESNNSDKKLVWEAPKLYSLDKGKTEGGTTFSAPTESFDYTSAVS